MWGDFNKVEWLIPAYVSICCCWKYLCSRGLKKCCICKPGSYMGDLVIQKGAEVCVLVECRRGWGDPELPKAQHGDVAQTGILEKPGWQARLWVPGPHSPAGSWAMAQPGFRSCEGDSEKAQKEDGKILKGEIWWIQFIQLSFCLDSTTVEIYSLHVGGVTEIQWNIAISFKTGKKKGGRFFS